MIQTDQGNPADQQEDLADLFRRASRMMARFSHRHNQVPHAQQRVLALIRDRGPIAQGELLALLDVRSSSLSEILRKLESNGSIYRKRNETDKRGYILGINEAHPGDATPVNREPEHNTAPVFACLQQEEQQQLRELLAKMIHHMGQEGRGGRGCGKRGLHLGSGNAPGLGTPPGRRHHLVEQPIRGWGRRKGRGQEEEND